MQNFVQQDYFVSMHTSGKQVIGTCFILRMVLCLGDFCCVGHPEVILCD